MSLWLGVLLLILFVSVGILLWFLQLFFPVRFFSFSKTFPRFPSGSDWYTGQLSGIPYLIHRSIPYFGLFSRTNRQTQLLNGEWEQLFDPGENYQPDTLPHDGSHSGSHGGWKIVNIPSVYNSAQSQNTDYLGRVWYKKVFSFDSPPASRGQVLGALVFHGALLRGQVWLNGASLGTWEGGFTRQLFPVQELKPVNELVVLTDNRLTPDSLPPKIMEGHNPGWHTYGGLYRDVELVVFPQHCIVKAEFHPTSPSQSEIRVLTWENNHNSSLQKPTLVLKDPRGNELSLTLRDSKLLEPGLTLYSWSGTLPLEAYKPWFCETPEYLSCVLSLHQSPHELLDSVTIRTGFRDFQVTNKGFSLNGKPIFLQGISKHEDHPALGPVQTTELIQQDLDLIQQLGANYIRMAHYPHDHRELETAAERGLLVSCEIPLYQAGIGFTAWVMEKRPWKDLPVKLFGFRQLSRKKLLEHSQLQLIQMIERDRNNPAVIFWCVGNECYTLGKRSGRIFQELANLSRRLDPTRPVTNVELTYNKPPLDWLKQGWRGMDFVSLNSYFGWYYGQTDGLKELLNRDEKKWGGKPLVLSEFGADACPNRRDSDGFWSAERVHFQRTYSEEYQAKVLNQYLEHARENPWIQGVSPWVYADFYNTWFPQNPIPNYNLKGIVSAHRVPKEGYKTLQQQYTRGINKVKTHDRNL